MSLTKSEFILKQLNKAKNKMYEGYVVHRLFTHLQPYDLRFSCQQYVKLANGKYALLDMFFPDLNVQIEIDEGHHNSKKGMQSDEERQLSVEKTIANLNSLQRNGIYTLSKDLQVFRIKIFNKSTPKSIEEIDQDIDMIVQEIKAIIDQVNPGPWNYGEEYSYKKYLNKTLITVSDNVQLRYISDVINLFGGKKDGTQFVSEQAKGFDRLRHFHDREIYYWCPQKGHKTWGNQLINDGLNIREKRIQKEHDGTETKRATFFKAKDNLGNEFYRFVGVFGNFKLDENGDALYERVSDSIEVMPVK